MSTATKVWLADAADVDDVCDWLLTLRASLAVKEVSSAPGLFAMFDAARFPEPEQLEAAIAEVQVPGQPAINLYGEFAGLGLVAQGPRLVALSDSGLATVARIAMQDRALGFLIAPGNTEVLARHLRTLVELRLPDESRALFRFHDSRVMSALIPLLDPEQLGRLLGHAHYWIAPEIHGCFTVAFQSAQIPQEMDSLSLTSEQFELLDERLLPHSIALQVMETDASLVQGLAPGDVYDRLYQLAAHGRTLGLTQNSDIGLFCLLMLQLPAGFERRPPFAEALERVRTEQISLDAAIDAIPQHFWSTLDAQLDSQAPNH